MKIFYIILHCFFLVNAFQAYGETKEIPVQDYKEDYKRAEEFLKQEKYDEAMAIFKAGAEKEDPQAQFMLGTLYYEVKKDPKEGAKWLEKAAMQNLGEAQLKLGIWYKEGIGVEKSIDATIFWLSRAVHNGNNEAGHVLYGMYEKGELPGTNLITL